MFVTILRGQVAHENWGRLQQHYDKLVNSLPEGLIDTYLIQNHEQPTLWEIITLWKSEEAFETGRAQKKSEAAELLFCDSGAVPDLQCFQVRRGHQRF
jgi:heme-degrading monooxygenase HmoA